MEEYECSIKERWYSEPTCMCLFRSFVNVTNNLFPVYSGFNNDNINIDPDFGDPSSLEPLTVMFQVGCKVA